MKSRNIAILLAAFISISTYAEEPSIIVKATDIEKKTTEMFYDSSIRIDIDGNGQLNETLYFSYSKIGPTPPCSELEECSLTSDPVITSYIETTNKKIHINFMCTSIGIYLNKTQGLRDIYCGPNVRLHWNGENYIEK
jgi:hypothetical protein